MPGGDAVAERVSAQRRFMDSLGPFHSKLKAINETKAFFIADNGSGSYAPTEEVVAAAKNAMKMEPASNAAATFVACLVVTFYTGLVDAIGSGGLMPCLLGVIAAYLLSAGLFFSLVHDGGSPEHAFGALCLCFCFCGFDLLLAVLWNVGLLTTPWFLFKAFFAALMATSSLQLYRDCVPDDVGPPEDVESWAE